MQIEVSEPTKEQLENLKAQRAALFVDNDTFVVHSTQPKINKSDALIDMTAMLVSGCADYAISKVIFNIVPEESFKPWQKVIFKIGTYGITLVVSYAVEQKVRDNIHGVVSGIGAFMTALKEARNGKK